MHSSHHSTRLYLHRAGRKYESGVKFNNFQDGDSHCLIEDISMIEGSDVLVFHQLYPNQNEWIVRLLLLLNTLQSLGAKSIRVFTPYLPYARQDKAHLPGESISNAILCRLLSNSGCLELYTIDCHFMKGERTSVVEGLRIHNFLVQDVLLAELSKHAGENFEIIGPDAGSSYLSNGKTMRKSREADYKQHPEGPVQREVATMEDGHLKIDTSRKGVAVVIADDMIATGSTIIKALDLLKKRNVQPLYVLTTHGFFLNNSYEKIAALANKVIYSDTIPRQDSTPVVDTVFEKIKKQFHV